MSEPPLHVAESGQLVQLPGDVITVSEYYVPEVQAIHLTVKISRIILSSIAEVLAKNAIT